MARTLTGPFATTAREVIIAEAARTPMGRSRPECGWFRDTHPNQMLLAVYQELLARSGLAPGVIEDLVVGCTAPFGEQSRNIARNAWLQGGYRPEVPAAVLDRRCGARLIATIVAELARRDVEQGLVTMCCGGGLGTATLIQRLDR